MWYNTVPTECRALGEDWDFTVVSRCQIDTSNSVRPVQAPVASASFPPNLPAPGSPFCRQQHPFTSHGSRPRFPQLPACPLLPHLGTARSPLNPPSGPQRVLCPCCTTVLYLQQGLCHPALQSMIFRVCPAGLLNTGCSQGQEQSLIV